MEEGMEKKEKEKRIELVLLFAMTNIERRETRILDSTATVFIFRATFRSIFVDEWKGWSSAKDRMRGRNTKVEIWLCWKEEFDGGNISSGSFLKIILTTLKYVY